MKNTLSRPDDRQQILLRFGQLSLEDTGRWGMMSVHQAVCHMRDSYEIALGQRVASPAASIVPQAIFKRIALYAPMQWPKGVPTRPEVEQGKGGTQPGIFAVDLADLLAICGRFCCGLPVPCVPHPNFGRMTQEDWMRWGYLHADHHLRQFGR